MLPVAEQTDPPLTTVRQDIDEEMGRLMARLLLRRLGPRSIGEGTASAPSSVVLRAARPGAPAAGGERRERPSCGQAVAWGRMLLGERSASSCMSRESSAATVSPASAGWRRTLLGSIR